MDNHRESDVADSFRHILSNPRPAAFVSIHPIDAAMILLVQDVRRRRVHPHTMRVMAVFGIWIGKKVGDAAGIERFLTGASVCALNYSATRHPSVNMFSVARVRIHL